VSTNSVPFGGNQLGSSARLVVLCVWTVHIDQAIFKALKQEINYVFTHIYHWPT